MIFPNKGKETFEITSFLRKLLRREPPMQGRQVMRAAILGYELGPLQQYLVYRERLNLDPNIMRGYEENAKLGMADLVTQLRMLCFELGWDFDTIQMQGALHLEERQKEFEVDGWAESNE